MAIKERMGAAQSRVAHHEIYQRAFHVSAIANAVMAFVILLSIAMAWQAWSSKKELIYFATREEGGIIPLIPVSEPFFSQGQVVNFAVEALTRSLSVDYLKWRDQLRKSGKYFQQPEGWKSFLDALNSSQALNQIEEKRLITNAVADSAVIIDTRTDEERRYTWTVQVPLTIIFKSSEREGKESFIAKVVVARLPTWENPKSIGITQVSLERKNRIR